MAAAFVSVSSGIQVQSVVPAVWTTHALAKIRPLDPPPGGPARETVIFAARNEFEPFQLVLRSETGDLADVDVQVSDLYGPREAFFSNSNITVYLERYLNLKAASSDEGDAGEWPDPLIPRVDQYFHERRNAFPFRLESGRNQPLWIEVYVPLRTPPGTYRGVVTVSAAGAVVASIPLVLTVWNFDLPSTSSLKTSFGFNGVAALKQHRGQYTNDQDLLDITKVYAKAALLHRISIHGGTLSPPRSNERGGSLVIDWDNYDREVGPFLDGTVFSQSEPLPGARATTVDLRLDAGLNTEEKKVLYWREWVKHFREKGWLDRLFYYVWDEPSPSDLPKVKERGRVARNASPELRNLVTTPLSDLLLDEIDIWAPLINCFEPRPGFWDFCHITASREAYDPEIQQGKSLWWYQACSSHGCGGGGGAYFEGWPSYVIDIPAMANRIMEWLTWVYRVEGELYYNLVEAYGREIDPWNDIYLFGGNGDGTLFYPGRPGQIGGSTHIPIESIRLKLIREGLEDYEYLTSLSNIDSQLAQESARKLVTKTYQWNRDPEALYSVRQALGEKLNTRSRWRILEGETDRSKLTPRN